MRLPLSVVVVAGRSMVPTLLPGDFLLVRRGARVRAGDLVVGVRPGRPALLLVKRAVRCAGENRWWIEGDNAAESDDSRLYGPVEITGRVLWRYWPPVRRRR